MANCGLPATSGFVGEFFVILSAIEKNFFIGFFAALTLILGAAYSLLLVKKLIFGPVLSDSVAQLQDVNKREFILLFIFAILVLVLGIKPDLLTSYMNLSIENLLIHVNEGKLISFGSPLSLPIRVT